MIRGRCRLRSERQRRLNISGKLALWTVVLLVVLSPLPEGSAEPWALATDESVIFGLIALWMIPLTCGTGSNDVSARGHNLPLPLIFFVIVVTMQLVPMPPPMLRIVSPATYRLYELSVHGWPRAVSGLKGEWRPLSIAPSLGGRPLLKVASYMALFSLVSLYPFGSLGRDSERYVYRVMIRAVLVSCLIVAVVGIVEFYTWNGKILWLFVPSDWGASQPSPLSRALGPFVNFDHFGNYLAVILPLAIGGALFRDDLFSKQPAFPLFCAVTAFFVLCALLLSASRGAWIAAAIALTVLMLLSRRLPRASRPLILDGPPRMRLLRSSVMVLAALIFSILFIGQQGRDQIDSRLQGTFQFDRRGGGRSDLTGGTLAMAMDYPILGVGLGCWPELYSHYEAPPWVDMFYREAHDDYAQLLAETGVVGFGLLVWFFVAVGKTLYRATIKGPVVSPILVALCASLSAMLFHEFFDFSLQTPANALLFTVLVALTVRMSMYTAPSATPEHIRGASWKLRIGAACVSAITVVLIEGALRQDKTPYPYGLKEPRNSTDAVDLISSHPAEASAHLDFVRLAGDSLPSDTRLRELSAAIWLDPNDPYARDQYATTLIHQKMTSQGFDNITHSIRVSPVLSTHFYLSEALIPRLTDQTQHAVERGFREAIELRYQGAVQGLGDYDTARGRYAEAGDIFASAGQTEPNSDLSETYLMNGGRAYARAGVMDAARRSFEAAIRDNPDDDRPYVELTTLVLGPQHQLEAAKNLVTQGVQAGADASALYDALARAADADRDSELTEAALRSSVEARPTLKGLLQLGGFYLNETKYARAALTFRRATDIDPQSAEAYFYLGVAEQSDYAFTDAERDFARAVRLAPENVSYRSRYAEFERSVAQSIRDSQHLSE
jgi:O-antigen ligase/tetratricopeptide (TPR) repeat protein